MSECGSLFRLSRQLEGLCCFCGVPKELVRPEAGKDLENFEKVAEMEDSVEMNSAQRETSETGIEEEMEGSTLTPVVGRV